jgi:hypothetical protein
VFAVQVPESCRDLSPGFVARVLAEHWAFLPGAARELGVSSSDLRRLTLARPWLLARAHEEMGVIVARAEGELIRALDDEDPRRREWAAGAILGSWAARDSLFAPARSRRV